MTKTLQKYALPEPKFKVTPDHSRSEHWYIVSGPDGGRFFSFTGYLALMGGAKVSRISGWSIAQAAKHAYGIMLTEDLRDNPKRAMEAVNEIKRAPKQALAKTADFGTVLHDFAEHTALHDIAPKTYKPPYKKDYDKGLHAHIDLFKAWWKASGLVPVATELRVAIPDLKAAGTLDLLAINTDGELVLIDFKTSKELYPEVQGQVAACNEGLFQTYGIRAAKIMGVRFGREDLQSEEKTSQGEVEALNYFKSLVGVKRAQEALVPWQ